MDKLIFNRDEKGFHFHIPSRHFFFIFVLLLMVLIFFVGGSLYLAFSYYKQHIYDSSVNKEELRDLTPPPVPPAIKNQLFQILREKIPQGTSSAKPIAKEKVVKLVRVPILMYHYVEYVRDKGDKTRISLNTTPYTLEEEIKTLKEAGYTFLTMAELADIIDGKLNSPQKPIILTFDDGYRDFYTDAYPILKKYQTKATQYVISGFINRANHLTNDELTSIASDGLVEIGAHTVHHLWLKNINLKTVSDEIFRSKLMLQDLIGRPVVSFAYPFGAFDEQSVEIVKEAGFRTAVSTLPGNKQGVENRFYLFRLRAGGRIGQSLLNWLSIDQ